MGRINHMFQSLKANFYRIVDFLIRLASNHNLQGSIQSNQLSLVSDSQTTPYEKCVKEINNTDHLFNRFRRIYNYRSIVDTVTYWQGHEYLKRINEIKNNRFLDYNKYKTNDLIGNPITYKYPLMGQLSPTTLRYISVALELENYFGENLNGRFVEIGAGYGGQYAILDEFFKIDEYGIFDLECVQELTNKYLKCLNKNFKTTNYSMNSYEIKEWDLVISNYAFSELPAELQMWYVKNIFQHSKKGYLIMNSGDTNSTGRNNGKMSLETLRRELPTNEILKEVPNTGPDNYVLLWGHRA